MSKLTKPLNAFSDTVHFILSWPHHLWVIPLSVHGGSCIRLLRPGMQAGEGRRVGSWLRGGGHRLALLEFFARKGACLSEIYSQSKIMQPFMYDVYYISPLTTNLQTSLTSASMILPPPCLADIICESSQASALYRLEFNSSDPISLRKRILKCPTVTGAWLG